MESVAEIAGLLILAVLFVRTAASAFWIAERQFVSIRAEQQQFKNLQAHVERKLEFERERKANSWTGTRQFQVVNRQFENPSGSICSFYLAPSDNRPIPMFRPGQFLTFEFPIVQGGHAAIRCYSISNGPTERRFYRITVKRLRAPDQAAGKVPDGFASSFLHEKATVGSRVNVFVPGGSFTINQNSNRPIVFVGGGVGITPLMSMLEWLVETRSSRQVIFFYAVQNRAEHAFYDYMKELENKVPNFHTIVYYSRPTASCRRGVDYDLEGHISVEVMRSLLEQSNYEFYVCGPTAMTSSIVRDLKVWGVPASDIKIESFNPRTAQSFQQARADGAAGRLKPINVQFARSKKTVRWTPGVKSLLELAEAVGLSPRFGCRQGKCGTCASTLKNGEIRYICQPEAKPTPGKCFICISQPKGDVTIDI